MSSLTKSKVKKEKRGTRERTWEKRAKEGVRIEKKAGKGGGGGKRGGGEKKKKKIWYLTSL